MNFNPIVFYSLSAGLVVSAILSTTLSKPSVSRATQVLMLFFCLGLLLQTNPSISGLILVAFCLSLLISLSFKISSVSITASLSDFRIGFLIWIVLGSFLLIIAVVLKYTKWTALRLEWVTDWKIIMTEYSILLTIILACAIAGLFWKKLKKT